MRFFGRYGNAGQQKCCSAVTSSDHRREIMTYAIACLLTAVLSAGATWLLCKKLSPRLGMRELGIKEIPVAVRDIPGNGEYAPRCGGLLPSAAISGTTLIMLLLHSLMCAAGNSSGVPRLSGLQNMYVWGSFILAPLFCAAGFMQDYAAVFRRVRRAISGWQSMLIRAVVAAGFLAAVWLAGDRGAGMTIVPFAGEIRMGFWYYPLSLLLIVLVVHGAEMVQEAEGAAPMVGFFSFLPMVLTAGILSAFSAGMADAGIIATAGACGCLAFLPFNQMPARMHTGRAGGAFTGGLLCAVCFAQRMPLLLLLAGAVYIAEAVTDLFARVTRLLIGKAAAAPLHRMIGRGGKNDIQITLILAAVTAVTGAAAAALAIFTI